MTITRKIQLGQVTSLRTLSSSRFKDSVCFQFMSRYSRMVPMESHVSLCCVSHSSLVHAPLGKQDLHPTLFSLIDR